MNDYVLLRNSESKEGMGICAIPLGLKIWRAYYPGSRHDLSSKSGLFRNRYEQDHPTVVFNYITEAEYTTYQELDLFPVYKWIISIHGEAEHHVDIFHPDHFFYHETPQKREILCYPKINYKLPPRFKTCPSGTKV